MMRALSEGVAVVSSEAAMVPFKQLVASDHTVCPVKGGKFEVVAWGRRFAALQN
jgi:hypothetical protein